MTDVAVGALAAFHAVLEERMTGRAASRLGVSQPALTQRIQSLERALNKQVFVRTPAGVELTPAGCPSKRARLSSPNNSRHIASSRSTRSALSSTSASRGRNAYATTSSQEP
jgi:hypothetical protein